MADKKFLITITAVDPDQFSNDKLTWRGVLDAVCDAFTPVSPHKSLVPESVYLLDAEQKDTVSLVLEHNAQPYPEDPADENAAPSLAKVLYLHDRRRRAENPISPP